MPARPARLLVLSPAFHGYWRSIQGAFTELGYAAHTHCYDARSAGVAGVTEAVRGKLGVELRGRLGHGGLTAGRPDVAGDDRAIAAIRAARPDRVLVVKGDELGPRVWQLLADAGLPTVVWLYDELRRTGYGPAGRQPTVRAPSTAVTSHPGPPHPAPPHSAPAHPGPAHPGPAHPGPAHLAPAHPAPAHPDLAQTPSASGVDPRLAGVLAVASYSPLDVATLTRAGVRAAHVPLAHDPRIGWTARPSRQVVFVGARYPSRERLLAGLVAAGVPVQAYGRDWSGHPLDRLRTWRLRRPAVPGHRDVSRAAAYGIMAGAAAALNTHSDQDGFTMRTFESAGVGALQLVDRADVAAVYQPGVECAVFTSEPELVELALRALADPQWARRLGAAARARTLAEHTFEHRARALEELWD